VTLRNPSFPQFFFVHEHFARFLTTVHSRVEPWWFFLPLLLLGVLPWGGSFLGALRARLPAERGEPGAAAPFKPPRFLLFFSGVTRVFFSSSGSKLAPYILPMLPPLAVLTAVTARDPQLLIRQAARIGAGLVAFVGVGLLVYSARHNSFVPRAAAGWTAAGILLALVAVFVTARRARAAPLSGALATALAAVLAWQCLMCAFALVPPARSARALVSSVRPLISAHTPLYSVGQYRETIAPYLGRTLQLAAYEGELQFGLSEEPQKRMTLEQFTDRWRSGGEAVAFFEPDVWDRLRRAGLPGRVLAFDYHTVAVSRL